jgi:hypothetical protein
MTQEAATNSANNLNGILSAATVTDQNYKPVETFFNYGSTWQVCLIPSKYNAQYDAATTIQQQAFGRVYRETQGQAPETANFVADFDTNAANDSVLGPYLGL